MKIGWSAVLAHGCTGVLVSVLGLGCGTRRVQRPPPPPSTDAPALESNAGTCLPPERELSVVRPGTDGTFPTAACIEQAQARLATLENRQKFAQMLQPARAQLSNGADVEEFGIGSVLSGGGSAPPENHPLAWAKMVNEFRARSLASAAAIPILYGVDAVHGHNNVRGAVIFPHNIGLGATRDADLVQRIGRATALAVAGTNIDWNFAPVLAAARDERWGRTYEAYGESFELAELLGPALIRGLQGERLGREPGSVLACAKHYLGDGNTSDGKDQGNALLELPEIRAQLLPAYQRAIEAGVGSVMVSFSSVQGVKMHCHGPLLNDVLKGELGFSGIVISDWEAVEQLAGDYPTQLTHAINAGVDMVMHPKSHRDFLSTMDALVPSRISQARIDDAVTRILTVKCELGMLQPNAYAPDRSGQLPVGASIETIGSVKHRELAREAVRKSLVLLKNENGLLPLKKTTTLLVAGRHADDIGNQCGGWTISWQGQSGPITEGTTVLEAVRAAVASPAQVQHARDGKGARKPEAAIVVIGERPYAEGKGDDADLALDPEDVQLVQSIASTGTPVVVVLISGRPLILEPILGVADAIVAAWLPGTEGSGIADVLFGDFEFAGRLSHSWPRSLTQVPINVGDVDYDPLFPYGFGLTTHGVVLQPAAPLSTESVSEQP